MHGATIKIMKAEYFSLTCDTNIVITIKIFTGERFE
jgi:hypothetical protein